MCEPALCRNQQCPRGKRRKINLWQSLQCLFELVSVVAWLRVITHGS
jgi:hypothetical protein